MVRNGNQMYGYQRSGVALPHFTLAGMARMETPVYLPVFWPFSSIFCPYHLRHRILPIVSPILEIFKTPGMAIAIPAILHTGVATPAKGN